MANEAVVIELGFNEGNAIRRTVASETNISGGTLCVLTDPNTASASNGTTLGGAFAGIITMDKDSSDGSTTASFYTSGVYDIMCGACTIGDALILSGINMMRVAPAATISGATIGHIAGVSEETGDHLEVIRVRLRGY